MNRIVLVLFVALITPLLPRTHTTPAASLHHARVFENKYLRIRLAPGWTVAPPDEQARKTSGDCCVVTITRGKYVLEINPVFDHASGIKGGRMNEILNRQPSVQALIHDDGDLLDFVNGCLAWSNRPITKSDSLQSLYLDPSKTVNCALPRLPHAIWFASYDSGEGPQSDYSIALTYNSSDLASLPRKESPELNHVLRDVTLMLRTLHLKPPIVVTKVVPAAPTYATRRLQSLPGTGNQVTEKDEYLPATACRLPLPAMILFSSSATRKEQHAAPRQPETPARHHSTPCDSTEGVRHSGLCRA